MRNATRQEGKEIGQALILWVLAATIIFAIGAITVDFGLWLTERRGAQKDADAATMAGAFELLSQDFVNLANNNFPAVKTAAEDAAYEWADLNGVAAPDVHDLVVDDTDCLGPSPVVDTVQLAAEHHTRALFTSIFGLGVPQIGAPAKACLGSINTAHGLLPVGVQVSGVDSDCWADLSVPPDGVEDPLFGQECTLTFGASEQTSGEAGHLRLFDDGSFDCSGTGTGGGNTYFDELESGGANTDCHVYKYFLDPSKSCDDDPGGCVYPLTGVAPVPQSNALQDLMASEGECNAENNSGSSDPHDEFLEVVYAVNGDATPSPATLFARYECTSPRLVSLIILPHFDVQGNAPQPILAFASFFIKGCVNADGLFSATCDLPGGQGQIKLRGHFVNLLETAGGVGQISTWSPKRITLVE
ncbi:MAG: Tad domain-containing protein [Dehalococcoidia bacterium]|nr:Tad domain-containing protein [Dehalococcoidia bacterium]